MTVTELTNQLAALYRAGKPFRFVQRASAALNLVPHAPELAALTLRGLVDLGYGGPARELFELRKDLCSDTDQARRLDAALRELPDGCIAWTELHSNFEINSAALRQRFPHLHDAIGAGFDALQSVELYRSRFGALHLSRAEPGKLRHWIAALSTVEDDRDIKLPERGKVPVCAVVGARTGAVFDALWEHTQKLFLTYSHPFHLLEPDLASFAAWLHVADHTHLLTDPRLRLFLGKSAPADLERTLTLNPLLTPPRLFVNLADAPKVVTAAQAACARVTADRTAKLQETHRSLLQSCANRDAPDWAKRLRPPGPVLAVTSRFTTVLQYATRDALAALRKLGYETHLLIEQTDHEQMSALAICNAIEHIDPALILVLDHLRYEYPQVPAEVPFLTWIQDPLPNLMCARAGASIGPRDLVCGILKQRCVDEFGYPPDQFVSLEMPVSLEVFHDAPLDETARTQYACEICFVSNASATIEDLHAEALRTYPTTLHPLLSLLQQRTVEMLARGEFPYDAAAEMTQTAARECGLNLTAAELHQLASFHTYRMLDWGRRQESLRWAAEWATRTGRSLRIYGRGWEKHPTLAPFAAGPLEHGEALRQALCAARLALQLIPSGFRHQRSYEILACGTLPLTRYCARDFARLPIADYVRSREAGENPPGENLFSGLERIAFETPEQLEALAEHYLATEAARSAVIADLRRAVLEHCTFDAAMRQVMQVFTNQLDPAAQRSVARRLGGKIATCLST